MSLNELEREAVARRCDELGRPGCMMYANMIVRLEWAAGGVTHLDCIRVDWDAVKRVVRILTAVPYGVFRGCFNKEVHVRCAAFKMTGVVHELFSNGTEGTVLAIVEKTQLVTQRAGQLNELEREVVARWCDEFGKPDKARMVRDGG